MYERTEMLIGDEKLNILKNSSVAVFGIGGVGSYICETLARAGVGKLTLIDYDRISKSNINRQIHALNSTVGKYKVDVTKERILDINPNAVVNAVKLFCLPDIENDPLEWDYDFVADAVDNVTAKLHIIEMSKLKGIKIISCMGTGNKTDANNFRFADIAETTACPLAKVMRKELKKRNVSGVKVLFSTSAPVSVKKPEKLDETARKQPPASISYVPSVAGLLIAGEIIKDLCHIEN